MSTGSDGHRGKLVGSAYFPEIVSAYTAEVFTVLDKESDRGCALVASAYIEYSVRRLLMAHCKSVSDVSDKDLGVLFKDFDSQFASLSSCVRLCRAVGYLDETDQKVLKDFGPWRNGFAHGTGEKLIEEESLCEFMKPVEKMVNITWEASEVSKHYPEHSVARQKFMVWASVMIAAFHDLILQVEDTTKPTQSGDAKLQ